jgi:hypothetical protein
MEIDPSNPVVALCAEGMAVEGDPPAARALFERAWAARTDDYDACIAAHYLARHQPTAAATLDWNARAVTHAEAVPDGRADGLLASLHLNLSDSLLRAGRLGEARDAAARARLRLADLAPGGYRDFTARAIDALHGRLAAAGAREG